MDEEEEEEEDYLVTDEHVQHHRKVASTREYRSTVNTVSWLGCVTILAMMSGVTLKHCEKYCIANTVIANQVSSCPPRLR